MSLHIASPDWYELIVAYFFLGGIAAGAAIIARLTALFGGPDDRRIARRAGFLAFPIALVCAGLLIVARGVSSAIGSWGIVAFIGFSAAAFVGALVEHRGGALADRLERFRGGVSGRIVGIAGLLSACVLGGDARLLLVPMDLPIWPETTWIGPLFLASGVSTGAAALILIPRLTMCERLVALNQWAIVLVLVLLTGFVAALGPGVMPSAFVCWPGVLIPAFVVPFGLVLPLVGRTWFGPAWSRGLIRLVLIGGLTLRWVIVVMPESLLNTMQ